MKSKIDKRKPKKEKETISEKRQNKRLKRTILSIAVY